nr:diguanylate cyclase [Dyella sp. ASV24]
MNDTYGSAQPRPVVAIVRPKLLIVDDQPVNIRALHQIFSDDHDVFMATNGADAIAFCEASQPDLVLLDVVMPALSGLDVCRALKGNPATADIPVIFVTSLNEPEEEGACWDVGGVDFITKPINAKTTRNRVRAHLTLKHQADLLRQLAWVDGLTGIPNKRQVDARSEEEFRRCKRDALPLAVAIVDIDYFKAFNDTYGHLAGDDCLRSVAQAIQSSLQRPGDFAGRMGGEEFIGIFPATGLQEATELVRRIDSAIRALRIPHVGGIDGEVTVSIGVVSATPRGDVSVAAFVEQADRALYQAKQQGRARVHAVEGDVSANDVSSVA